MIPDDDDGSIGAAQIRPLLNENQLIILAKSKEAKAFVKAVEEARLTRPEGTWNGSGWGGTISDDARLKLDVASHALKNRVAVTLHMSFEKLLDHLDRDTHTADSYHQLADMAFEKWGTSPQKSRNK